MENDCLVFGPTIATTYYGMNDGGYTPFKDEIGEKYRKAMTEIVAKFKKAGVGRIVVGSPGVVDSFYFKGIPFVPKPANSEIYNQNLAKLGQIGAEVAKEAGANFADVNSMMMEVMKKAKAKLGEDYDVAGRDGVHPGPNGHLITAYVFLKALGCDGNIGTITVDMKADQAEASDGHKVLSAKGGTVEVESSRYPFCFFDAPKDGPRSAGTKEIIQFMPFNQDLNRLMLVVKNASADKMKVTWGDASKTFDRAALESGVNLAAEFLDNPFSAAFKKGEEAIRSQQNWETPAVKELLHRIPEYRKLVPEQAGTFDPIPGAVVAKDQKLREAAVNAVTAVKHTIVIAPAP
jgi:hypothetical protein